AHLIAEAAPEDVADLRALDGPVISFSDETALALAEIKAYLFKNLYRHWRVKRMRQKTIRVVRDLFEIMMEDPGILPGEWREAAKVAASETLRARVVADYIAGMTDRFALEEHRVLTDPRARA
ncbi:MAG: deoxyguanosinetriphosphate triphosphohydrolase, partial [Pseudomonadota bacterium]